MGFGHIRCRLEDLQDLADLFILDNFAVRAVFNGVEHAVIDPFIMGTAHGNFFRHGGAVPVMPDQRSPSLFRSGSGVDHMAAHNFFLAGVMDHGRKSEAAVCSEIIKMLHDAVQSYIDKDFNKAKNVIAHDDVIDDLYHVIKKDLVEKIRETTEGETILDYLLIAKYIERIGDHATNIAEWVIFALTGERG